MLCLFAACYSPPRPDCGFLCSSAGACPTDYHCAADGVCHRDGTPADTSCGRDAGIDARIPDAPAGDFTPPQVTLIVPGGNETGILVSATIQAGFDEDVLNAEQALTLRYGAGAGEAVAGTVTYDPALRVATLTPTDPLIGNTAYAANVSTIVTDLAGNALAMPMPWTFTTGPDGTPPIVTMTSPMNNATGVPLNATISVTFTEPVQFFNAANVAVSVASTPITGTFSLAAARTMVFTPDTDLPAASTIDVSLSSGIVDYSNNPLTATAFSFTTQ